jgi:uncharacterized protein (DUF2267 family)
VDGCAWHQGERGEVFDHAESLRRVAAHLHVTALQAEATAQTVFAPVRRRLPSQAVHDVTSQLPRDLQDFWMLTLSA